MMSLSHGLLFFAAGIIPVLFLLSEVRRRETDRILKKTDGIRPDYINYGVSFFGSFPQFYCQRERLKRSRGALFLRRGGQGPEMTYLGRWGYEYVSLPLASVTGFTVKDTLADKKTYKNILVVFFRDEAGIAREAGFDPPHPEQWAKILKRYIVKKNKGV